MGLPSTGSNPRYVENLRVGGGYGSLPDGGVDVDGAGNAAMSGDLTVDGTIGEATFSGDVTVEGDLILGSTGVNAFWETSILRPGIELIAGGNNPPSAIATKVYAANRREIPVATCDDSVTSRLMGMLTLPNDYDGRALGFDVYWSVATSNSGSVFWQVVGSSDNDGDDLTNTATASSVLTAIGAAPTAVDQMVITSGTWTPSGADGVAGQMAFFSLIRSGTSATDTYTAAGDNAHLIGIKFYY